MKRKKIIGILLSIAMSVTGLTGVSVSACGAEFGDGTEINENTETVSDSNAQESKTEKDVIYGDTEAEDDFTDGVTSAEAIGEQFLPEENEETEFETGEENQTLNAMADEASGICGDSLTWSIQNDTLTISGNGCLSVGASDTPRGKIAPEMELNKPWKEYDYSKIVIKKGITEIGKQAFSDDYKAKEVLIEDGLTKIGEAAFSHAEIQKVVMPDSVEFIDDYAFNICCELTEVKFSKNLKTIGKMAFRECAMAELNLPEGLKKIGVQAFNSVKTYTSLKIPSTVVYIGDYAFNYNNCTSITIPEGVVSVGGYAFHSLTLKKIVVPASVTNIGQQAFYMENGGIAYVYKGSCAEAYAKDDDDLKYKIIGQSGNKSKYVWVYFSANDKNEMVYISSRVYTVGSTYGDIPNVTTYEIGKKFVGWYTKPTGGTKINSDTVVKNNKEHTLYAHWIKNAENTETSDLKNATITVKSCVYNGKRQKPAVTVKLNDKVLQNGIDYKVSYSNNINVGSKAKVKVVGMGRYSGTQTVTFKIKKAKQSIQIKTENLKNLTYSAIGKKYKISIRNTKEWPKVTYVSSNTKVAVVKGNNIVIKGTGSAKISISFRATKHYNAVTKEIPIRVLKKQKIKIGLNTNIGYTEEKIPINATASGKLTYKSLNTDIAEIDADGMIKCNSTGKVTIQIAAEKTEEYAKATKKVTFIIGKGKPIISCPNIEFTKNVGDEPFALGVLVNSDVKLKYSSDNMDIASVNEEGVVSIHEWNDDVEEKVVHITISSQNNKLYNQAEPCMITIKIVKFQKAKWFMNYVNISQVPGGDFSHQGTQNFDVIGTEGDNNIFAPFDCKIVKIYPTLESGNTVVIESLKEVQYADGTIGKMSMAFAHDNDISNLHIGDKYKQGEIFYQTGNYGYATGIHSHVTCIRGEYKNDMWTVMPSGQSCSPNAISPMDALFIGKNMQIINAMGLNFKSE